MSKKLLRIGLCIVCGTLLVVFLYWISGAPNTMKNGFSRKINDHYLTTFHFIDLKIPHYRIVGASHQQIFLSNPQDPLKINRVDYALTYYRSTGWVFDLSMFPTNRSIHIDSPQVDIFDRQSSLFINYNIQSGYPVKQFEDSLTGRSFDAGLRSSNHQLILRTLNLEMHQHTLTKIELPGFVAFENKTAIERQVDGYLCTDGILLFDHVTSRVVYLYLYRNQFLILDSNLQLIKRAQTIDTISRAEIQIHHFKNSKAVTFESPPLTVNKKACVWNGRLYIQSGLLSDNEDRKTFTNNFITDVYDLKTGRYEFSFYIPHFSGYKLDDFQVYDHLLVAIHGEFIVSYLVNDH